ncbi:hypothetical protein CHCC20335_1294 [Bacillus paralicheniformis]|nr:hypothetical protein CHCC20335_1294 [Bacillus paralicheniformis]
MREGSMKKRKINAARSEQGVNVIRLRASIWFHTAGSAPVFFGKN